MSLALLALGFSNAAPAAARPATPRHSRSKPATAGGIALLTAPGRGLRKAIHVELARIRAHRRDVHRHRRPSFAALPGGVSRETLASIAACESGGNPGAISPGGTYRGKYQFDQGTWESVGGRGDPAAAPEGEQDYRAALLILRSGTSPWPVCG